MWITVTSSVHGLAGQLSINLANDNTYTQLKHGCTQLHVLSVDTNDRDPDKMDETCRLWSNKYTTLAGIVHARIRWAVIYKPTNEWRLQDDMSWQLNHKRIYCFELMKTITQTHSISNFLHFFTQSARPLTVIHYRQGFLDPSPIIQYASYPKPQIQQQKHETHLS